MVENRNLPGPSNWPILVTENLYIGKAPLEGDIACLENKGVTQVIDLRESCELSPETTHDWASRSIRYLRHGLSASGVNPPDLIAAIVELIKQEARVGGTTYLHCTYGKVRSPLVAAAYIETLGNL